MGGGRAGAGGMGPAGGAARGRELAHSRARAPAGRPQAPPPRDARERAVRVAAAVRALAALHLQIFPAAILDTYKVGAAPRGAARAAPPARPPRQGGAPPRPPPTPRETRVRARCPLQAMRATPPPPHTHTHARTHAQLSVDNKVPPKDMLQPAFLSAMAAGEAARRHAALAAEAAAF